MSEDELSCPPEVHSRILQGEAVLVHIGTGTYFGTDEVGTVVWERILRGTTFGDALRVVVAQFEVDEASARGDLAAFVDALVRKGLCRVSRPRR